MGQQRMEEGIETHPSSHQDHAAATVPQEVSEREQATGSLESGSSLWPVRVPRRARTSRIRGRGTAWCENTLKKLGIHLGAERPGAEKNRKHPLRALEAASPCSVVSDEDGASSVGPVGPVLKTVQQLVGGSRQPKAHCPEKKRRGKRKARSCREPPGRCAPEGEATIAAPSDFSTFASVMTAMEVGEPSQEPSHRLVGKGNSLKAGGALPNWVAEKGRSRAGRLSAGSTAGINLVVSGTNSTQAGKCDEQSKSGKTGTNCDPSGYANNACDASVSARSDESIDEKETQCRRQAETKSFGGLGSNDDMDHVENSTLELPRKVLITCRSDGVQTLGDRSQDSAAVLSNPQEDTATKKHSCVSESNQVPRGRSFDGENEEVSKVEQWQNDLGKVVGNQGSQGSLPNGHIETGALKESPPRTPASSGEHMEGTPNTVSDVGQSATASVGQVVSGGGAPCQNRPPPTNQCVAPSTRDSESKGKKVLHNGSTVRRIPQGDGLGPLKPWPSFDYGMSGEEYLTLFHQRNVRLHALQGDDGFDSNHPIEIDMDDQMVPENPFMNMEWHQRDMMGFPAAYMGFFGVRPPMMPPMMMCGMDGFVDYMGMPFGFMNPWRREPETCQQPVCSDRNVSMWDRTTKPVRSESVKKEQVSESGQADLEVGPKTPATVKREGTKVSPGVQASSEEAPPVPERIDAQSGQPGRKPMFSVPTQPIAGFGAPFPGPPFQRVPQGPANIPEFLNRPLEATPKAGSQGAHAGGLFGMTSATIGPPEKSPPTPPVNPSTWVANVVGQGIAGVENQTSNPPKGDSETEGVIFFHNSSFEPVDPPWKSKLAMEVEMEISEGPFPEDVNFSMSCFESLDGNQDQDEEEETVLAQAPAAEFGGNVGEGAGVVLLSDGEEAGAAQGFGIRGRRCGRGGRGGRMRSNHDHRQMLPQVASQNASGVHRTKGKRKIRPKGKDGRPRIYTRIPKVTSLVPTCINGGLHKVILEDLESHVKDYVDDSDALDRLVQDIESYLTLLQRRERNGQKADWCEGCIEVILRGLQNSRVDPEEAKESGLLDSIQKITKHRNGKISRAARQVLKEDWAIAAFNMPESEAGASPVIEAHKRSIKPPVE